MSNRSTARKLASDAVSAGRPLDWFDELYRIAEGDESAILWADMTVNPNLHDWLKREQVTGHGRRVAIVGCGPGDDAELLQTLGFTVTAFDISPTAIEWCRRRFPDSAVDYCVVDLFDMPPDWNSAFDLIVEVYTLQVFPMDLQQRALEALSALVADGGTLLVIARGRDDDDDPGSMPWPLRRRDLDALTSLGLSEVAFEDFIDQEDPPVRRFRAQYSKV